MSFRAHRARQRKAFAAHKPLHKVAAFRAHGKRKLRKPGHVASRTAVATASATAVVTVTARRAKPQKPNVAKLKAAKVAAVRRKARP